MGSTHKPDDTEALPGREHPSQEAIRETQCHWACAFLQLPFCTNDHRLDVQCDSELPHYLASLSL